MNIDQRAPRKIDRVIHPERVKNSQTGWLAGDGGWGDERLEGYETDMDCQVDQFWAHEINEEDLFRNYLASGVPVLIRGLIDTWPVVEKFTDENLKADHGNSHTIPPARINLPFHPPRLTCVLPFLQILLPPTHLPTLPPSLILSITRSYHCSCQ